jgi:integrase
VDWGVGSKSHGEKCKMAIHKLRPSFVDAVKVKGTYGDGGGLYLSVGEGGGAKSWLFRWGKAGTHWMGLGSAFTYDIHEARAKAREQRKLVDQGIDPIAARRDAQIAARLAAAKDKTFAQVAQEWIDATAISWEPSTRTGYMRTLANHINPKIGDLPIQNFDMEHSQSAVTLVHEVLRPLWTTKTVTALDAQSIIYAVLNYAIAKQDITGTNAAALKGGPLGILLPKTKTFYAEKHFSALPHKEIGAFVALLRRKENLREGRCKVCKSPQRAEIEAALLAGTQNISAIANKFSPSASLAGSRKALANHRRVHMMKGGTFRFRPISMIAIEFLILTAARVSQVSQAEWSDVDWEDRLLVSPARRESGRQGHKIGKRTGQDHIIPLSDAAMDILREMQEWQKINGLSSKYIFPARYARKGGGRAGHLGITALKQYLRETLRRRAHRRDFTLHGMRTCFATWAEEQGYEEKDSEMQLGHVIGNNVRNIYKREAHRIEPRRAMMQAWADYCSRIEPLPGKVVNLRAAAKMRGMP